MKVVVVASFAPSLAQFRLPLLRALAEHGADVVGVAPPERDEEVRRTLDGIGARFRAVPMSRTGLDPVADLRYLNALVRTFREERPDVVLAYTIKPVVYGMLAARWAGVPTRVALVTGLGYAFGEGDWKQRLVGGVARLMYRAAMAASTAVVFQNPDDREEFLSQGLVAREKTSVVAGSGVPLDEFEWVPPPEGPPTFLLVARLIREKGVALFAEAARVVRRTHPEARFQLLGPFDDNPGAVSEAEVAAWQEEGTVEYLGVADDVRPHLQACSVFVLPSYYREGTPRSALEALATGRPVVTTDAPGCRETVRDGHNGFLVPPRDSDALAEALTRFADDPELVPRMGRASRELAEERYDVRKVNASMLRAMGLGDA